MPTEESYSAQQVLEYGPSLGAGGENYYKAKTGQYKLPRNLKKGATGENVLILRQALIEKYGGRVPFLNSRGQVIEGFALPSTGGFDKPLEDVVKAFQKKSNLKVDGIVGKNTWTALLGSQVKVAGAVSTALEKVKEPVKDEESGKFNWARIAIIGTSLSLGAFFIYMAMRPKKNPESKTVRRKSNPRKRKRVSSRRIKANRSRSSSRLRIRKNP